MRSYRRWKTRQQMKRESGAPLPKFDGLVAIAELEEHLALPTLLNVDPGPHGATFADIYRQIEEMEAAEAGEEHEVFMHPEDFPGFHTMFGIPVHRTELVDPGTVFVVKVPEAPVFTMPMYAPSQLFRRGPGCVGIWNPETELFEVRQTPGDDE